MDNPKSLLPKVKAEDNNIMVLPSDMPIQDAADLLNGKITFDDGKISAKMRDGVMWSLILQDSHSYKTIH